MIYTRRKRILIFPRAWRLIALAIVVSSTASCNLLFRSLQSSGRSSQIEGIYFVPAAGFGVGGFMTINHEPYLLLKDGTVKKNLSVAPEQLDFNKSKQAEPQDWGRWRKQGKKLIITWNKGKPQDWETWYVGMPARPGDTLNGTYKTISGGGNVAFGGGTTTFSSSRIRFSRDGIFAYVREGGAISEEAGPYGTGASKKVEGGRYSLNGYTLTLKFTDGRTEHRAFYFYTEKNSRKDEDAIGIGDAAYTKDDD